MEDRRTIILTTDKIGIHAAVLTAIVQKSSENVIVLDNLPVFPITAPPPLLQLNTTQFTGIKKQRAASNKKYDFGERRAKAKRAKSARKKQRK